MSTKKRSRVEKKVNDSTETQIKKRLHLSSSHTLYLTNINSKINIEKMKLNLYVLFATYADVMQVHYPRKGYPGQAWIVVSSSDEAQACINNLHHFNIFEKPVNVQFSRKESSIISKLINSKAE